MRYAAVNDKDDHIPFEPINCDAAAHAVETLSDLASQSSLSLRVTGAHRTVSSIPRPPSYTPSPSASDSEQENSVLHPRVAVLLGVDKRWHLPLLLCRAISTVPAAWWGLRCALTFMGELLLNDDPALPAQPWSVEKRFRVTEVFLAVLWCCASAYLSFFFTDCLMSRWLLHYTPQATLVRLLTTNSINAYITSWVLYLSGGSEDPRLLLPAWISIAAVSQIPKSRALASGQTRGKNAG
ncbi:hypothetical protein BP5796_10352 [Coleophoma crateriformis]|uniref:N-glycosylation protein EOS1 n=1 Tax=Coleophoma crateriformis TaxID=565419 RepID=A0A3D8QQC6_9HELO|nr:hypothetical protein BP5796_10352 [Coleophoma crateriformis]